MTAGHRLAAATVALVVAVAGLGGAAAGNAGARRLAGVDRAGTAAAVALDGWSRADTVVVAEGRSFAPAVVGAHLAARLDAPLLLSGPVVPRATAEAASALAATRAVVVGDAVVAPEGLEVVARHDDPDPVALAADAAAWWPVADQRVVVASSERFPDALAAANLAPAVLLLTPGERLAGPVADAIEALAPAEVVLMGGAAALAAAVADDVAALGPSVRRIAGATRVETALAAATRTGTEAVVASAAAFPDSVAAVAWAARHRAPVLLTGHDELAPAVDARLRHVDHAGAVVLGGTAAVGNFVDQQVAAALADAPPPGFEGTVRVLSDAERSAMTGTTWREGCPVALEDLVAIDATHWTMDGNVAGGGLVVHRDVADEVAAVLGSVFDARFPIASMRPIHEFDGDDDASMAANNTSAFNCRTVAGTSRWSEHASGWAIDVNPVQNPFVRGDDVAPPAGTAYLDRDHARPGMIVENGPVVAAFDASGWGWGGRWSSSRDYQHFSLTGG